MSRRILFLARSLEVGGAEIQLASLVRRLHLGGAYRPTVVTFYPGGVLAIALAKSGVPVISLGKRGRWDSGAWAARLLRTLKRVNPDILHSYLGPPNVVAALMAQLSRPACLFWGLRASDMDHSHYDWTWRAVHRVEQWLSRIPDGIIVNSYAGLAHAVQEGFDDSSLYVVPNGIDTDKFCFERSRGEILRAAWLGGSSGPLVGIAARLDPMKDHRTFFRAAATFAASHHGARFVCIGRGNGEYAKKLRWEADGVGLSERLVWAGEVGDMSAAWNALDLATLSSSFGEGFPNVIGEAMACGVPCVSTDVGDTARIINDASRIVPRGDASALAAAWSATLALPRDVAAAKNTAGRERIVEAFSVEAMVARTTALYDTAIGNS